MAKILRQYSSTIHGDYRRAYLLFGLVTGVVLSLYLLVRHLLGVPSSSPSDIGKDVILILILLVATFLYRKHLPDQKVTFKELILLGLGTGFVAAVIYGLFVFLYCGVMYPDMTAVYAEKFRTPETTAEMYASALNPAMWALVYGFLNTAVTSIIVAFFGAILFKNEKSEVVEKK